MASDPELTAGDIHEWIDAEIRGYPKRATGNEIEHFIARLLGETARSQRAILVDAMRQWIDERSEQHTRSGLWIADAHRLVELRPDIEALLADVRTGKALMPYYAEFIERVLARFDLE